MYHGGRILKERKREKGLRNENLVAVLDRQMEKVSLASNSLSFPCCEACVKLIWTLWSSDLGEHIPESLLFKWVFSCRQWKPLRLLYREGKWLPDVSWLRKPLVGPKELELPRTIPWSPKSLCLCYDGENCYQHSEKSPNQEVNGCRTTQTLQRSTGAKWMALCHFPLLTQL